MTNAEKNELIRLLQGMLATEEPQSEEKEEIEDEPEMTADAAIANIIGTVCAGMKTSQVTYNDLTVRSQTEKCVIACNNPEVFQMYKEAGDLPAIGIEIPDELAPQIGQILIKFGQQLAG